MCRARVLLWLVLVVRYLIMITLIVLLGGSCSDAIESPQYNVVLSTSDDLQIRLYRESLWISAPVSGEISFKNATHDGFHRLYQYIHGANQNSTKFNMTAPIPTTITQTPNGYDYVVSFYLPQKYGSGPPPLPFPELNLQIHTWKSHCTAVRTFPGFAEDDNIGRERETLKESLKKLLNGKADVLEDKTSYTIAQYNASFHLTGRVNEVWINLSECP